MEHRVEREKELEVRGERIQKNMKALADGMERMVKRMKEFLAACDIKLQPSHAEDPSCPEVIRTEEQPTKETLPSPFENLPERAELQPTVQKKDQTPPSRQTPPLKINPSVHPLPKPTAPPRITPAKPPLPKPTVPPQITPAEPSLPKTTAPPPYNDSQPTYTQKKTQKPIPTVAETQHSHQPCLFSGARGKKRRACDWSRRRKRKRYKPSFVVGRRDTTKIRGELAEFLGLGVKRSNRGKKDPGLGKRGPKKKRQVRRDNVRGFKVPEIRRLARKRLREQTGPWLRSPFTGRRQGTGLGRMGSEPENPTKCSSLQMAFPVTGGHPAVPQTVIMQRAAIPA
jgi:hypothetical protein